MPEILNMPRCEFEDRLHNDPTAEDTHGYAVEVQCEKPWHRLAILLAASGHTTTEIAEKLERSIAHVSILLRQPWARERLTTELAIAGRDEITAILKSAGAETLKRVILLSKTAESEQVQLAASREVLDRLLGKPVQKLDMKQEVFHTDVNALDDEIKKLELEEERLTGHARN